jgi:hypothetical protein
LEQVVAQLVRQGEMVAQLARQGSHGGKPRLAVVRLSVKSDCIHEFIPGQPNQTSAKWVDKIDQLARANRWDENTTIQLMQNRLAALSRTWYDTSNMLTYTYTWEEGKKLLIKTFPDYHDFASTLRQSVNRMKRPNETMTQYYFGKMKLLQGCNITNKEAVSCLIEGLMDRTLKNGAKAGRYGTPEQNCTPSICLH